MYLWYFNLHLIAAISWMVFLLQFIKTFQYDKKADKVIFNFLSLFFMLIVLFLEIKMILMNPAVAKKSGWLHTKLSFVIILMLENIYLSLKFFKKKKITRLFLEILYWLSYILFILSISLSLFKPF